MNTEPLPPLPPTLFLWAGSHQVDPLRIYLSPAQIDKDYEEDHMDFEAFVKTANGTELWHEELHVSKTKVMLWVGVGACRGWMDGARRDLVLT